MIKKGGRGRQSSLVRFKTPKAPAVVRESLTVTAREVSGDVNRVAGTSPATAGKKNRDANSASKAPSVTVAKVSDDVSMDEGTSTATAVDMRGDTSIAASNAVNMREVADSGATESMTPSAAGLAPSCASWHLRCSCSKGKVSGRDVRERGNILSLKK